MGRGGRTFRGSLEDRLAIRELYGAYSDAAMRQDRDLYLSLWSENGLRVARDGTLEGKDAIARHWDSIWGFVEQLGFFSEISSIVVEGERATTRNYCREIVKLQTGACWKVIGRYEDVLVKRDGEWLFQERVYTVMMDEGRKG